MGHGPQKYICHVAREIGRLPPLIPLDKNFPKWGFPAFYQLFRKKPRQGRRATSAPAVQFQNLDRCWLCVLMPLFFAAFAVKASAVSEETPRQGRQQAPHRQCSLKIWIAASFATLCRFSLRLLRNP